MADKVTRFPGAPSADSVPQDAMSLLSSTQVVIREALARLGFGDDMFELLKEPMRVLTVRFPVRMDNGSVRVFTGYRAQHNDAVGPTKGGILFHPGISLDDIKALAIWMTIKCGIANLPYGGAKGGVDCNPREMSFRELERVSRAYVRAISQLVGPTKDIPSPDVLTNSQIMAWMMDEYSRLREFDAPGFITGKPLVLGGSRGRESANSRGIAVLTEEASKSLGINLSGARVIVLGFGSVGSQLAEQLHARGAQVVGISDAHGGLYNEKGLDIPYLLDRRDSFGNVTRLFRETCSAHELIAKPCDILVPASAENQITSQNADSIQAKLIVEVASGATTLEATRLLSEREATLVPDVMADIGSVALSYFEWVQNNTGLYWSEAEVNDRLNALMVESFRRVYRTATTRGVDMRLAAYMAGIHRVAEAVQLRGWL